MIRGTLLLAVSLFAFSVAPANASCAQGSVAGVWKLYAAVSNVSGETDWNKCSATIAVNGKLSAASCQNSQGGSTPVTGQVSLSNAANCTYTGTIHQTLTGITDTINEATLSIDKRSASGVGKYSGGGFVFTMVKVR